MSGIERRVEKLTSILDVAKAMTIERDLDSLLRLILEESKRVVEADRCTIFVLDHERGELWSRVAHGLSTEEIRLPVGKGIAGWVAQADEVVNITDAYNDPRFNRSFDDSTGYQTRAILCAPMRGPRGEVAGVIQALNPNDGDPFDDEDEELLLALGGQAASAIENALLHKSIETLFEGFVTASVVAIEARDPTTSGHSERVARLTVRLAEVADNDQGEFRDLRFTKGDLREIRYAALLHDFGKVGVREHVLVKEKKLPAGRIELMRARFDVARTQLERNHYRKLLELGVSLDSREGLRLQQELERGLEDLNQFFHFVEKVNMPRVLERDDQVQLEELGRRIKEQGHDGLELVFPDEVEFLSIPRGSLAVEERKEIERHVSHTFRFLRSIPWTRDLRHVPEIAHAHHEKLDGSGYPRGLSADSISIPARMMAVADIYDALTAHDRPYKPPLSQERALDILQSEARRGLIDASLLQLFIDASVAETALGTPNTKSSR